MFTVLDPACGSGVFLNLALHALQDIEHRVQIEAEALGFPLGFPVNAKSIEINACAARLAKLSVRETRDDMPSRRPVRCPPRLGTAPTAARPSSSAGLTDQQILLIETPHEADATGVR